MYSGKEVKSLWKKKNTNKELMEQYGKPSITGTARAQRIRKLFSINLENMAFAQ